MSPTPEKTAPQKMNGLLTAAGWSVQDAMETSLYAARSVAPREYCLSLSTDAQADYFCDEDGNNAGVIIDIRRVERRYDNGFSETCLRPSALQSLIFKRNAGTHRG